MSSTMHEAGGPPDLVDLVQREIQTARSETRPTSRQQLADVLHARTGMPLPEAFAFVDSYCDEHEPGVPGYLQEEFAVPYLKVVAIVNVFISIGLIWYGVVLFKAAKPPYAWFCMGVVFFGLGALSWVKSLEREVDRRRKK